MRKIALILLALLSTTVHAETPRQWNDSIRDVYIDGKLDRTAQTLTTSAPRMIAVVCGEEVLLVDPEQKSVTRANRSDFTFAADRVTATTTATVNGQPVGEALNAGNGTYLARIDGKTILLTSHQSSAGPLTIDQLWETAPVWRAIADVYTPDEKLVKRLESIDRPVTLDVVLATWCGDSRYHVPRLLKSIAAAANPNITVQLIGLDAEFTNPMEVIGKQNITNVPTVIVRSGQRELGRFVETPASGAIEDDVCDIVAGTPKPHPGRLNPGTLVSSGIYLLRDAKKRHEGTETFQIYERPNGTQLAHSVIAKRDGTRIETWASAKSIEVTHYAKNGATRTRFHRDGDNWAARSRGVTGLIEQVVLAPAAFVAPATITYAWARDAKEAYVAPERGVGATAPMAAKVAEGQIPRYVKFADGSSRVLVR